MTLRGGRGGVRRGERIDGFIFVGDCEPVFCGLDVPLLKSDVNDANGFDVVDGADVGGSGGGCCCDCGGGGGGPCCANGAESL